MLKLFPNMSIMLKQIQVSKTSVIQNWVYKVMIAVKNNSRIRKQNRDFCFSFKCVILYHCIHSIPLLIKNPRVSCIYVRACNHFAFLFSCHSSSTFRIVCCCHSASTLCSLHTAPLWSLQVLLLLFTIIRQGGSMHWNGSSSFPVQTPFAASTFFLFSECT